MENELKSCPFCGGEADVWVKYGRYGWFAVCECSVCSASGKTFSIGKDCPEEWEETNAAVRAKKAWNRRCSDAE